MVKKVRWMIDNGERGIVRWGYVVIKKLGG